MNLDEMLKASGISGGAASGNDNVKSGFVTFIGRPNVGKSTLMNNIIGQKIAITSNKPQTTRNRIQTVYTDERGQIVFVDTPGIHKAKNKLGTYMVNVAERTLNEVDVVLWLVEPSTFIGAGEHCAAAWEGDDTGRAGHQQGRYREEGRYSSVYCKIQRSIPVCRYRSGICKNR